MIYLAALILALAALLIAPAILIGWLTRRLYMTLSRWLE